MLIMNINAVYSPETRRLLSERQMIFLIPDEILIRDGVACGDAIMALGECSDNIILFKLLVIDGCIISQAISAYLFQNYSGKNIAEVKKDIIYLQLQLRQCPSYVFSLLGLEVIYDRIPCVQAPIELLASLIEKLFNHVQNIIVMKDTIHDLDCDACVRSSSINWSGKTCSIVNQTEEENISVDYRKKWLLVSKHDLNAEECKLLHNLASTITQEDMLFLRHEKIAQCVFSNLLRYDGMDFLHNSIWKIIYYQIHRKHVVHREIEIIADFLPEIGASFIKGINTSSLYEDEKAIRIHLDYDILCFTEHSAWLLGCFLLRRGFLLFENVFSLKKMTSCGNDLYQGHFHMQKILDDQYKIVVDINFPGFPVGRVGLFYPQYTGLFLSNEDQFIITLCHTFKHKNVFMKDLNDLALMLKKRHFNFGLLLDKIKKFNLEFFASIAMEYIVNNYEISQEIITNITPLLNSKYLEFAQFKDWPYSAESMLSVKKEDLKYRSEIQEDIPRIYLFPLVLFKRVIDAFSLQNAISKVDYTSTSLSSTIFCINVDNANIIISEMGIFLDNKTNDGNAVKKNSIRDALKEILRTGVFSWDDLMEIPTAPQSGQWFF